MVAAVLLLTTTGLVLEFHTAAAATRPLGTRPRTAGSTPALQFVAAIGTWLLICCCHRDLASPASNLDEPAILRCNARLQRNAIKLRPQSWRAPCRLVLRLATWTGRPRACAAGEATCLQSLNLLQQHE